MESSYLKAHHSETVTLSGHPISTQTIARIPTHALGDPKASRAQAVPLYQSSLYISHAPSLSLPFLSGTCDQRRGSNT